VCFVVGAGVTGMNTYGAGQRGGLALAAARAGAFDAELVHVKGMVSDERPRRLTEAVLSRMRPAVVPGGTVTAGNSCGISDGAAVVAMVPEHIRSTLGVPGLSFEGGSAWGWIPSPRAWDRFLR
jgi:acetyl-CoA C-acetyltransferase